MGFPGGFKFVESYDILRVLRLCVYGVWCVGQESYGGNLEQKFIVWLCWIALWRAFPNGLCLMFCPKIPAVVLDRGGRLASGFKRPFIFAKRLETI